MERIRTVIVDDESLARKGIEALLERDEEIEVIGCYANGMDAVKAITRESPDLLFLDVQMPGVNGFEVLSQVPPHEMPVVIFVTAYDEFAIQAFEVHALDYLLKSYSDERFAHALNRAKKAIRTRQRETLTERLVTMLSAGDHKLLDPQRTADGVNIAGNTPLDYLTRLVVKEAGRIFFVRVDEINWIESADYYVCVHVGASSHLLRETMRSLERRLDPHRFQRIHRSTIINLDRIREVHPYQHGDYLVILEDGTRLKLSRSYRSQVETALGSSF